MNPSQLDWEMQVRQNLRETGIKAREMAEARRQERAHARRTDPISSQEAAASVKDITANQQRILDMFEFYGPMSDEELVSRYHGFEGVPPQSSSGIRTRRHELAEKGRLQWEGYRQTKGKRRAMVWRVP